MTNDYQYDKEAWEAFMQARRDTGKRVLFQGTLRTVQEWEDRGAPSVGARALSILRNMMYPPSYIAKCEAALALFLSDRQRAERFGFNARRKGLDLTDA